MIARFAQAARSAGLRLSVALLALAAGACGGEKSEEMQTSAAVPVRVAPARSGPLTAYVTATGTVEPAPDADWTVTAPQAARISEIRFAAGDRVPRGAVVARFDAPGLRAELATRSSELAQAAARLDNARANHERLSALLDKGIASRRELEDARKELLDAQAKLRESGQTRSAAAALAARATAVAPFDGLVAQRWHNPGDLVDANERVLRLVDPRRLEVTAAVPVADAPRIVVGRSARVRMPGGAAEELPARVAGAPAAVDAVTGTAAVRLTLDGALPVGTPVQVEIVAEQRSDALIVPPEAVVRHEGEAALLVVGPDGKAHRRAVALGLSSSDGVEVRSGLRRGEPVVIEGQEDLPDGATVTVELEKAARPPRPAEP